MGKTLLIAEKPSVGKDLATYLGIISRGRGFFTCKGDIVCTWCIGHILEQADPDSYDPKFKRWRAEDLPIIPENWILEPIPRTRDQLQIIDNLLKDTTKVINAGDPEREGQLIVDEVLDFLGYDGPAERLWISALDIRTIKKGFANLRDNNEFQNIKNAAICASPTSPFMMSLKQSLITVGPGRSPVINPVSADLIISDIDTLYL